MKTEPILNRYYARHGAKRAKKLHRIFDGQEFKSIQADSISGKPNNPPVASKHDDEEGTDAQMFSGKEPSSRVREPALKDDIGTEPHVSGPARHVRDRDKSNISTDPMTGDVSQGDRALKTLSRMNRAAFKPEEYYPVLQDLSTRYKTGPWDANAIKNPDMLTFLINSGFVQQAEQAYRLTDQAINEIMSNVPATDVTGAPGVGKSPRPKRKRTESPSSGGELPSVPAEPPAAPEAPVVPAEPPAAPETPPVETDIVKAMSEARAGNADGLMGMAEQDWMVNWETIAAKPAENPETAPMSPDGGILRPLDDLDPAQVFADQWQSSILPALVRSDKPAEQVVAKKNAQIDPSLMEAIPSSQPAIPLEQLDAAQSPQWQAQVQASVQQVVSATVKSISDKYQRELARRKAEEEQAKNRAYETGDEDGVPKKEFSEQDYSALMSEQGALTKQIKDLQDRYDAFVKGSPTQPRNDPKSRAKMPMAQKLKSQIRELLIRQTKIDKQISKMKQARKQSMRNPMEYIEFIGDQLSVEEVNRYSPRLAQAMKKEGLSAVNKAMFLEELHSQLENNLARRMLSADFKTVHASHYCQQIHSDIVSEERTPKHIIGVFKKAIEQKKVDEEQARLAILFTRFCDTNKRQASLPKSFNEAKASFNLWIEKASAKNEITSKDFIRRASRALTAKDYTPYGVYDEIPDGAGQGAENYDDPWDIEYTVYNGKGDRGEKKGASIGVHKSPSSALSICIAKGKGTYIIEGKSRLDDSYWGYYCVSVNDAGIVDKFQKQLQLDEERGG